MKILVLAGFGPSLINFRGDLLKELVANGHAVMAMAPSLDKSVESKLRDIGVESVSFGFDRGGLNPLADAKAAIRLYFYIWNLKPDVFFAYTIKPVVFGALVARWGGVRRVYTMVTGLGYAFVGDTLKQKFVRILAKVLYWAAGLCSDKIFFQNRDDLDLFRNLGILRHGRVSVIDGSGVNLDQYQKKDAQLGEIIFLFVGRLYLEKGIREFIQAAEIIRATHPNVKFRVVGAPDRNPNSLSEFEIQQWVKQGLIEYYGWQDDVRPHYDQCSVFVLPSYREGIPRTALEAMAVGRAIITTNAPGCRETVKSGVNGWTVPVGNAVELANVMERFIKDPELITKMGDASRLYVVKRYDVKKINNTILTEMGLLD